MSLEINYIDAPEGAQEKMIAESIGGNAFSSDALIASGGENKAYATLEPGLWRLDGTRKLLPDDPHPGWWSVARSDENGQLESPPVITITFPVPYSSTGFTFTFSPATEQWCSEIHVSWYNGQTLIVNQDYFPDSANWTLLETVESFDKIVITLKKTNHPGQDSKNRSWPDGFAWGE